MRVGNCLISAQPKSASNASPAKIDALATASVAARVAAMGSDESGAEAHYAALDLPRFPSCPDVTCAPRRFCLPYSALWAPGCMRSAPGVGTLPMLLAALGVQATGIESSDLRASMALAVPSARLMLETYWPGALAPQRLSFTGPLSRLHGRERFYPDTVAVTIRTSPVTDGNLERRDDLLRAHARYGCIDFIVIWRISVPGDDG